MGKKNTNNNQTDSKSTNDRKSEGEKSKKKS
jgi:hypothetical protein